MNRIILFKTDFESKREMCEMSSDPTRKMDRRCALSWPSSPSRRLASIDSSSAIKLLMTDLRFHHKSEVMEAMLLLRSNPKLK